MELTNAQIEVFAAGLYAVAQSDGLQDSELTLFNAFLEDAGAPHLVERLPELTFDPVRAYDTLAASWLRKLFLKAALMVIRADHEVTEAEQEMLVWIAGTFGVDGGYAGVVEAIDGDTI